MCRCGCVVWVCGCAVEQFVENAIDSSICVSVCMCVHRERRERGGVGGLHCQFLFCVGCVCVRLCVAVTVGEFVCLCGSCMLFVCVCVGACGCGVWGVRGVCCVFGCV